MKNEENNPKFLQLQNIGKQIDLQPRTSKIMSKASIIESCQIRIPQDQIILKDSGQKALINSIMCPICLITLPMPYYECEQCNNSFCPNCIEDWWAKHEEVGEVKACVFKCEERKMCFNKATFKKVKRSNTYVALLETLQFKCTLCKLVSSLSSYEKHKLKQCPQADIECENINCYQVVKRKDLSQHEKTCQYRLESCRYCTKKFAWNIIREHQENVCPQKIIKCGYKRCDKLVKVGQYESHSKNCVFKQLNCTWCSQDYLQAQFDDHQLSCPKRKIQCSWCNNTFSPQQFQLHNCPLAKQVCKLCQLPILCSQIAQHKNLCMFEHLVSIKHQNKLLIQDNAKLHLKVTQLQQLMEDTISSSQGKALEVMRKYKMNQRKQLQKDLMRIDYSMASVNRLKDEEIKAHMEKSKFLILGHSLCIQCKLLEKKFMEMIEPLAKKRKEVIAKIQQFDKFSQTARG